MQNTGKSRKMLIIGIVAAVVVLAVVLGLLLTQCTGGQTGANSTPSTTVATDEVPTYELYWNIDRALYDGKSEAGMSSRMPESDGYFHVRFVLDGEEVTLKVADRKVINAIDVNSLMGLEFDENGIVIDVVSVDDMPLEKVAWQFYVQSAGGKTIKANSSSSMNGMEVILEGDENTGVYNVSGLGGEIGSTVTPISQDRIYAVQNLAGELTHVFVFERPNYMLSHEAECEHCGKTVSWSEWNKEDRLPVTTGHYQLQNDVTTKKQSSTEEDAKICLDLNGYRVDGGSGSRVYALYNVGAELALMDTSEAKTGTLAAHGKGDQGMVVWVRYGQFHLYSGILDGSDATTTLNGTVVSLAKNTYMYMYGGEIIGGTATYTYNEATKKYGSGLGGAVYLTDKSKFVMHDGVIRDGFAEGKITAWNKDGSPKTYQRGLGGNIFMASGSVMELNGGVIKNGKAFTTAGNIYMDGTSELTINGGSIQGGRGMGKGKNGGSLFITTKATVHLKSGRITGGTTYNCGGNVYLNGTLSMSGGYIGGGSVRNFSTGKVTEDAPSRNVFNVNGTFRMYGGTIDGGVQATDSSATDNKHCFVGLTTYATIDGGEKSNNNLTLAMGAGGPVQVNVGDLRDSAKIRVKAYSGVFTTPTSEKNVDNFVSDIESAGIHYYQGCIALGRMSCLCGSESHFGACDGTKYLWTPHVSKTALPIKDGFYYLDNDVTSGSNVMVGDADIHVRLDLNGKTVTSPKANSGRAYSLFENVKTKDEEGNYNPNIEGVSMQLTVTDTAGGGKIVMSENQDRDQGGMFWGRYPDSVINIYGGTFDGSASASTRHMGVVICTAGDLNIYGGTIIGGTSTMGGNVAVTGSGSTMTMTGGTITGGTASGKGGGNVYISKGVHFVMTGGTISDGEGVKGGNVYISGSKAQFDMTGGTISGGYAQRGGNVANDGGTTVNLSGGTITGGNCDMTGIKVDAGLGGNLSVDGVLNMTGGVVSDGYVRPGTGGGHGGNIMVGGTANLEGGIITGGNADNGGNIATIYTNAVINLGGNVQVLDGTAVNYGGNLAAHVRANKAVNISGGTIAGGKAKYGGNISFRFTASNGQNAVLHITDGVIRDGVSKNNGANLYLYNTTEDGGINVLTMDGGQILDGKIDSTAAINGGNIFLHDNTEFVLNGGTISGGTSTDIGGNIYTNGTLIINGGEVKNGKAKHPNAFNVACVNGDLTVTGGVIEGGVGVTNTSAGATSITLSGKPYIFGEENGTGLTIRATKTSFDPADIKVEGQLAEGSKVAINDNGYFSLETVEQNKQYFVSAVSGKDVYFDNSRLFIGNAACLCGSTTDEHPTWCDGEDLLWQDWRGTDIAEPGNYNVTGDVTLGRQMVISADANLNLNGYTISFGSRVLRHTAFLGLTDHKTGGAIVGKGIKDDHGGALLVGKTATLNHYRGKIQLNETHNALTNGGAISIFGKYNLYDGQVVGGEIDGNGGAIFVSDVGNAVLYGGTVTGGSASCGGSIYVDKKGSLTIKDGLVTGGHAEKGGNIYITKTGTFVMEGGTIENGTATRVIVDSEGIGGMGGNILIEKDATATVGGIVKGGVADKGESTWAAGGNIYVSGELIIDGAQIFGGTTNIQGQNIYVNSEGAVTMNSGSITNEDGATAIGNANIYMKGGSFTINGGTITSTCNRNFYTNGDVEGTTITLNNGTVVAGNTVGNGGNIYIYKGTILNVNGGEIKGGAVTGAGGNIYVNGTMNMTSGTISGGHADAEGLSVDNGYGGNISVSTNGVLNMSGGVVTDGYCRAGKSGGGQGGNIFVQGTANLTGGTVEKGDAKTGGNVSINRKTAVVVLDGVKLLDGNATDMGGNLALRVRPCERLEIKGNTLISGGTADKNGGNFAVDVGLEQRDYTITIGKDVVIENGYAKSNGGNIFFDEQLTLIVSGTVKNGDADDLGGNIYVNDGGKLILDNATVSGGTAANSGGNLALAAGSTAISNNSILTEGSNKTANKNGGNVWLKGVTDSAAGAKFTMNGGSITKGTSMNTAGNLYVGKGAEFTMTSGEISGGKAKKATNGNIHCVDGTLDLQGGTIAGGVLLHSYDSQAKMKVSGDVIIYGAESNLTLEKSSTVPYYPVIQVGALGTNAKIGVYCAVPGTVVSTANDTDYSGQILSDVKGNKIVYYTGKGDLDGDGTQDANKLFFGLMYCICGVDSEDPAKHLGTCGGEKLVWEPWTSKTTLPTTTGNYYLTADVTFNHEKDNDAAKEYNTSGIINIDLNGHTVSTAKDLRIFRVRNGNATTTTSISVTDSSEKKTGRIVNSCTASTLDGAIVWLTQAGHSFSLYSGTLDASNVVSNTNGTAMKVNYGTVNIYGGTVKGGTTTNPDTNGASIRINAPATLNMTDGTLDGGTAINWGGTLVVYGTANITGGTIKNGIAKSGHNIAVIKDEETSPATLNISNATVAGGIELNNAKGNCVVTLNGKVIIDKTLGDTALNYGLNFGSVFDSPVKVDMSGLTDDSLISITARGTFGTNANDTIKGYFSPDVTDEYIILDDDKLTLGRERCLCGNLDGDCIDTVCNGEKLQWTIWGEKNSLPADSGNYYLGTGVSLNSTYYPTAGADVKLDLNGKTVSRGGRAISMLDREGITLTITDTSAEQTGTIRATGSSTAQGAVWVRNKGKLILVRGTIDGSKRTLTANDGLTVTVTSDSTFEMHGGKIIGGTFALAASKAGKGGSAIYSTGTTTVFDGEIIGGTSNQYGGAVCVGGGTFTMKAGSITGGSAVKGGALAILGGTFKLEGGTISGGQASEMGGNVYISGGTYKQTDGRVIGGTASVSSTTDAALEAYGGNIGQEGGNVELLGGTVEDGKVISSGDNSNYSGGGNIAANAETGSLTLNGVTVKGGNVSPRGGNIYLFKNGIDMTIAGNTIITGGAANYGGNICIDASERAATDPVVVTMTGGTLNGGNARAIAANVALYKNAKFVMDDGEISGGVVKGYGGNVLVDDNSKFVMNGGSITGGESGKGNSAARDGGNIYIDAGATFELNGGTVSGGKSTGHGGNFYVAGTLIMNNGTISGGEAGKDSTTSEKNGGNVYVAENATFELNNGTVSGGKSNNSGGNIHVLLGTMKMTDGTVNGGSSKNSSSRNIGVQGGTLEMSGGKVEGHVTVLNSGKNHDAKVILSGEPVISGGTLGLKLHRTGTYSLPLITVKGTLGANAKIVISKEVTNDCVISDTTAGASVKAFVSQDVDRGVYAIDNATEYPGEVGCLYLGKYGCVCGGISGTECAQNGHPKVKWTAWSTSNRAPGAGTSATDTTAASAGNYYLTGNINVGEDQYYSKPGEYNIDLNGYNITGSASRLFRLNDGTTNDYAVTIGIKNSRTVEDGGIISSTKQGAQEGYLIWVTHASQVVNLYSGTLDGGKATTVDAKSGGCVNMYGGTFNMFGGEIKDGNATANGGNIAVCDSNAEFNLFGGTVSGGNAKYGGNIATTSGGTANLFGGTVSGGDATSGGGNIYVLAKLNLKGTTVENGTATSTGGNIHVGENGNMIMTNGLVTGGNAAGDTAKDHENVYCRKGTLDLRGGEIDGFTMVHYMNGETTALKVSGTIKLINGNKNLRLVIDSKVTDKSGCVIQLGKLESGAKIGIYSSAELFATSASGYTITAADKAFFTPESSSKQVVFTKDGLELKAKSEIWRCVCGGKAVGVGDHKCVDVKWTETDTIPNADGNYILTDNVSTSQINFSGKKVSIDLNGHELSASNDRVFYLQDKAVVNITDTDGNGRLVGKGAVQQGGAIVAIGGSQLNIFAGTLTSTNVNGNSTGGGVLYCSESGTTITMYNGIVTGGNVTGTGGNVLVYNYSTFIMYDGKIDGGKSTGAHHANVHCKWANMEIYGGEIAGGVLIQSYNDKYSTIKISGNPVIYDESATSNLRLVWSKGEGTNHARNYPVIQLGKLTKGANIHISDISTARVIAEPAGSYVITDTDADYFKSDISTTEVVMEEGKLKVVEK